MTEDEAKTVAELAAQCVRDARSRQGRQGRQGGWGLIMRYGRLFTPGTDAGGGAYPMVPAYAGKNAYQRAMDSGLLYAEGYACVRGGITTHSAWCLDGETVVYPGFREPGTAYFGVPLRSGYVRRVHEAQRHDDGSDGFRYVFMPRNEQVNPPLDPASDIVADLGREIPSSVRDWALTAEPPSGGDQAAPAWVMDELLGFGLEGHGTGQSEAPLPMSYARYLIRCDDAGMSLACSGRTGGIYSDNGAILDEIRDGDSLDTLIRMADEHRPRCEWAVCPDDERERPELTVQTRAEVHLRWVAGFEAALSFAVLHRLDYNVWDAWLHPLRMQGQIPIEEQPVLLTRNGVSYEMALMAVFRAMGDKMPEEFAVVYL